ncbi:hypothetical protein V5N11_028790 [Cardamine amara subsp. amara]|uniref:RNase H type-1 domain-containing protein n=1 Tax=Cardamine amara subsp. amara TaxID=228776 RepID=A0ABD1B8R3_CARAN
MNDHIGAGWIIRDERGLFKLARSTRLTQAALPIQAKALALLHALQSAWCRGYRKVVMEGDCKPLFDIITQQSIDVNIDSIVIDIRSWVDRFSSISFSVVPRECNKVADMLAKVSYQQHLTSQTYSFLPHWLRSKLYHDSVNNF